MSRQSKQNILCLWVISIFMLTMMAEMPKAQGETVDLNSMLLSSFKEWDAFTSHYMSNNGTLYDPSDFSRKSSHAASNVTLSGLGFYLLALARIYNATQDAYYLNKLKFWVDTIKDSSWFTVSTDVGVIWYSPQYWYEGFGPGSGSEHDAACLNNMAVGIGAVLLYKWLSNTAYKAFADRIANESRYLIVVNNSTDQAWSCSYYALRDEPRAKTGVNRQGMIGYFYSWYGKEINSTYLTFVPKIFNWIWRAQISGGGLGYSIGDTAVNTAYSCFATWMAINSYHLNPSAFSAALKLKIMNTLVYFRDRLQTSTNYMQTVFQSFMLLAGLKDAYFSGNITSNRAKSFTYLTLQNIKYSGTEGIVLTVQDYGFGWRWQIYQMGAFFSEYPFLDGSFNTEDISQIKLYQSVAGSFPPVGYTLGFTCELFRDGGANYGVGYDGASGRYFYVERKNSYTVPSTRNMTASSGYYWKSDTAYTDQRILMYYYPSAVYVADVSGTAPHLSYLNLDYNTLWKIYVANGSSFTITSLNHLGNYTFGTKWMAILDSPTLVKQRVFYVESPITKWTVAYSSGSYCRVYNTTASASYRVVSASILASPTLLASKNRIWNYFGNLTQIYNVTQPISFSTMLSGYTDTLEKFITEPPWLSLESQAFTGDVRLISHNLPEQVSLTSWALSSSRLSFTISASTGITSITKIHTGSRGAPLNVLGASSWSYDANTQIVTVTKLHSSPATVHIFWKFLSDLDDDNDVDASDLYLLAVVYGTHLGDPSYNSRCDLDWDGDIDADDLHICSEDYGKY